MSGHDDAQESHRRYGQPYGKAHPIPTIQKYRAEKEARELEASGGEADRHHANTWQSYHDWWYGQDNDAQGKEQDVQQPNTAVKGTEDNDDNDDAADDNEHDSLDDYDDIEPAADTSEIPVNPSVKQRRKGLKKGGEAERQVTDPITHLPVTIRDFTSDSLKNIPENDPAFGSTTRTASGLANKNKTNKELQREWHELERSREADKVLFPPPEYGAVRNELVSINRYGTAVSSCGAIVLLLAAVALETTVRHNLLPRLATTSRSHYTWLTYTTAWLLLGATTTAGVWAWMVAVHGWVTKRVDNVWADSVWHASSKQLTRKARAHETETVSWLNSLLSSVWPLINPDLFTSLADTLEDVMQASIPSVVRMVSVDDIGQGSESVRILGIRWLPTGAAARSVDEEGKLKPKDDTSHTSDRRVPDEGEQDQNVENKDDKTDNPSAKDNGDDEQQQTSTDGTDRQIAEGMEAEDGDFVNLEVSFAYRASKSKSFEDRAKDMHLYLSFYLIGNVKIPVWVDLRGIIGTMRLRLQLAPDPPFFGLCTLTFLGQPKVDISCIPLVKRGLNIMDLPLLSNFVQGSVDAAVAEYVAPKSLTLDLKDMLAGDDFKKDTTARGVLVVQIKRGYDFREGDPGIPLVKEGGSDPYVSVGWAKFGKPLFSTRILLKEMEPYFYETAYLLVSPQELDVDERLRIQLWDSDRLTADDDLGRIELPLKQIMKDPESNGKMSNRRDGFRALKAGEKMPGKLEWSVGYFSKVRLQEDQFKHQTFDPKIRSMDDLDKKVDAVCRRQLREAMVKDGKTSAEETGEFDQNKAQEMKRWQDGIRVSAPPPEGYHSGVFSIQIHQITGLGLEKLNKSRDDESAEADDEEEEGEHLPSAYCTVIINHNKVFKTRTKPANAKPFYNAGTERYLADYRNAEVFVTVRDARIKEIDPLLGIVHLPLGQVFSERSQINGFYPLVGGIGFGRIRLSMVWTSVQLQLPPQLTGWDYGTLEVQPDILSSNVPFDISNLKLKFLTDIGSGKMRSHQDEQGQAVWQTHKSHRTGKRRALHLPVRKHYSSCLAVQFRRGGVFGGRTAAFGVLWLRNIPDEDEQEVEISVWKETNSGRDFERARQNAMVEAGLDCSPEKLGSIKLKLSLWSGMGGAHHKWAQKKDQHTRDVIEVLQCSRDNYESHQSAKEAGIVEEDEGPDEDQEKDKEKDNLDGNDEDSSDSDSSDSGSDDEDEKDGQKNVSAEDDGKLHKLKRKFTFKKEDDAADKAAKHAMAEEQEESHAGASDEGRGKSKQSVVDAAKEYKDDFQSKHRKNRGLMQYRIPRTAQWAFRKVEKQGHRLSGLFEHSGREPGIETEV